MWYNTTEVFFLKHWRKCMWQGLITIINNRATRTLLKKLAIDIGIGIVVGVISMQQKRKTNAKRKQSLLHLHEGPCDSGTIGQEDQVQSENTAGKTSKERKSRSRKRSIKRRYMRRKDSANRKDTSRIEPVRKVGL